MTAGVPLTLREIRAKAVLLNALPDGAELPDWSGMTIGQRVSVLLRMIPPQDWRDVLGKSPNHIRKFERGLELPLSSATSLCARTGVPIAWLIWGKQQPGLRSGIGPLPRKLLHPGIDPVDEIPGLLRRLRRQLVGARA